METAAPKTNPPEAAQDSVALWVRELALQRTSYDFPIGLRIKADHYIADLMAMLFPHFASRRTVDPAEIENELVVLRERLLDMMLSVEQRFPGKGEQCAGKFFDQLPIVQRQLLRDATAIYEGDPAATSFDEVILSYPGFYAIAVYRLAHALHVLGCPLLPRMFTEHAHRLTGIDIHPGAKIGDSFFIDHGTGIVIGETTVIGDRVKLYQGVILGALAVHKHMAASKRHPTVENDVVAYAHATILGGETVIGHNSVIGGSAWITQSIVPYSVVTMKYQVQVRDASTMSEVLDWSI
jgi:serine O-acetyltransferase